MQIHIFLDGRVSPAATTELPDDPDTLARGRNGWFRPRQITIWRGVRIMVAVRSRRQGDNAPHPTAPGARCGARAGQRLAARGGARGPAGERNHAQ